MVVEPRFKDERGLTMGASYWARWACNGQVENMPSLLLPCVLAEGYDLLFFEDHKQVFDRGGVMRKLAWSLNGGRWSDAPVDLTVTYAFKPARTVVNFTWKLAVRPYPTTQKEQASFETWVRGQLDRIVASLAREMEQAWTETVAEESAGLRGTADSEDGLMPMGDLLIGTDTVARPVGNRGCLQCASTYVEEPPTCERCWKPSVAIPGTVGRYYCLICRRHLPRHHGAQTKIPQDE